MTFPILESKYIIVCMQNNTCIFFIFYFFGTELIALPCSFFVSDPFPSLEHKLFQRREPVLLAPYFPGVMRGAQPPGAHRGPNSSQHTQEERTIDIENPSFSFCYRFRHYPCFLIWKKNHPETQTPTFYIKVS